ncbi:uncharacterized protein LOC135209381 [Macrobrachium nipponense]|uniref:uncharacterized protein LOC135209381 n=1 Tax=Macrobrachium nipponense TaxID=159736 RepID=UPI0030C7C56D
MAEVYDPGNEVPVSSNKIRLERVAGIRNTSQSELVLAATQRTSEEKFEEKLRLTNGPNIPNPDICISDNPGDKNPTSMRGHDPSASSQNDDDIDDDEDDEGDDKGDVGDDDDGEGNEGGDDDDNDDDEGG